VAVPSKFQGDRAELELAWQRLLGRRNDATS